MYCEKCGTELSDEAAFCSQCGHEIHKTSNKKPKIGKIITNDSKTNEKDLKIGDNNTKKYLIIGLITLAIIIILGIFVLYNNSSALDGTVVLSDTCSIKTIGENVEVKNNKALWTIENENYTIFFGNYLDNTNQYNNVVGLFQFNGMSNNDHGTYQGYYLISKSKGNDAILIKAKDKATAETLADNIQFK